MGDRSLTVRALAMHSGGQGFALVAVWQREAKSCVATCFHTWIDVVSIVVRRAHRRVKRHSCSMSKGPGVLSEPLCGQTRAADVHFITEQQQLEQQRAPPGTPAAPHRRLLWLSRRTSSRSLTRSWFCSTKPLLRCRCRAIAFFLS